jgi:hypothetical protein
MKSKNFQKTAKKFKKLTALKQRCYDGQHEYPSLDTQSSQMFTGLMKVLNDVEENN